MQREFCLKDTPMQTLNSDTPFPFFVLFAVTRVTRVRHCPLNFSIAVGTRQYSHTVSHSSLVRFCRCVLYYSLRVKYARTHSRREEAYTGALRLCHIWRTCLSRWRMQQKKNIVVCLTCKAPRKTSRTELYTWPFRSLVWKCLYVNSCPRSLCRNA